MLVNGRRKIFAFRSTSFRQVSEPRRSIVITAIIVMGKDHRPREFLYPLIATMKRRTVSER